jgi:type VI secretion system protein ImpL
MKRKLTIVGVAAAIVALFVTAGSIATARLGLHGREVWLVQGAFWFLGILAAGAIAWLIGRRPVKPPAPPVAADIDAAMLAARTQLARTGRGRGTSVGTLPVVLVLGPPGSSKTTLVVRSGLDPELLAGDVFRGDVVAPTPAANLWYSGDVVFAEAGGKLLAEPPRWLRFVHHLQPRRAAAVGGRGAQAPRVAVVCYSCEELVKPGAAPAVQGTARALRERLGEVARELGIRLPVYVLFTKADRIPGFADYVHTMTGEEARDVLGVTLPADAGAAGTYADRETRRLSDVFATLFGNLAARRVPLLTREHAPEHKPGAYEFPREFRKAAPTAVQFLLELCRPSELQVSPFLRGFYFTGVRAVVLNEGAAAPAAAAAQPAMAALGTDATGVFSAARAAGSLPPAALPPVSLTRKVPQWVFLPRIFPEIVLGDRAALAVTQGGARVNFLRRTLLAAAAAAAVVLAVAFTVSYVANRLLQADVREAASAVAALPATQGGLASADVLRRLDALRVQVARLGAYERGWVPPRLRWGLYTGSALYPDARRLYFDALDRHALGGARAALLASLRALPDSLRDTSDYGPAYARLKAHLVMTAHPERSSGEFLGPVLLERWLAGRSADAERQQLAGRQFAFYGDELRIENPYGFTADDAAVVKARTFLASSTDADRIYRFMLDAASRGRPPLQYNRAVPGSAAFVAAPYEVPGAYTRPGWTFMQDALKHVDRFLAGERWVLGPPQAGREVDQRALASQLRARYTEDYVKHWRAYVSALRVVGSSNMKDAVQRLGRLSTNQSPLLGALALAAQQTHVGDSAIIRPFQPLSQVVPVEPTDKIITEGSAPYAAALAGLGTALDQATKAPPGEEAPLVQQVQAKASDARAAVQTLAQTFNAGPAAPTGNAVQTLLTAPIVSAEGTTRGVGGPEGVNRVGASFCAPVRDLMRKAPFTPGGPPASADELSAFLKPPTGSLWKFYDANLAKLLVKQGNEYAAVPQGSIVLTRPFVDFFNRAATFAEAMYKEGSQPPPQFSFNLEPAPPQGATAVTFTLDDEAPVVATANGRANARIDWTGTKGHRAQITAQYGAESVPLKTFSGPWAVLQLLQDAVWRSGDEEGSYELTWSASRNTGQPVRISANLSRLSVPVAVLRKGYLSDTGCRGPIARQQQ